MSIVGTRPPLISETNLYEPHHKFAQSYSDKAAVYVLEHMKYKKATIAFLESFLEYLNVNNS